MTLQDGEVLGRKEDPHEDIAREEEVGGVEDEKDMDGEEGTTGEALEESLVPSWSGRRLGGGLCWGVLGVEGLEEMCCCKRLVAEETWLFQLSFRTTPSGGAVKRSSYGCW